MASQTLAERLSRYAANLQYEDLPPDVIHEAKRRLIDSLGCAIGAYPSEPATIARTVASTVTSTTCRRQSSGRRTRTSPEMAAFANGVHFRYLDYNDTYLSKEPAHPSDNLAAILAVAGSEGQVRQGCDSGDGPGLRDPVPHVRRGQHSVARLGPCHLRLVFDIARSRKADGAWCRPVDPRAGACRRP